MFQVPARDSALTQGDIFDGCPLVRLELSGHEAGNGQPPIIRYAPRVIVLTQACDLAQAKASRVLVARLHLAQDLVDRGMLKSNAVSDQIRRHLMFGWYFLPAADSPISFQESIIDLREVHTVPQKVLEDLVEQGNRPITLASPYREHLAQHFAVTYMRVALPQPYQTQPAA